MGTFKVHSSYFIFVLKISQKYETEHQHIQIKEAQLVKSIIWFSVLLNISPAVIIVKI